MTRNFASIELARLYETQGYFQDALSMYQRLDDDVLKGGAEIRAAVKRLELTLLKQDDGQDLPSELGQIEQTLIELNDVNFVGLGPGVEADTAEIQLTLEENEPNSEIQSESGIQLPHEKKMALLLEKWLMLMVVQRRLNLFKAIRARL